MEEAAHLKLCERLGTSLPVTEGIRPGGLELTERALTMCGFPAGSRLLDIGCGSGATLDYLQSAHGLNAVGVDSSSVQLKEVINRLRFVSVVRASGTDLPFCSDSFHGVFLECVLSLMEDRPGALGECNRVLKPGGRIILSDVYARNPHAIARLRSLPLDSCVRGATSFHDLKNLMASAGFEVELLEDHSDCLKEFAVRMVWRFGSLAAFWGLAGGKQVDRDEIRESIRESRLGYYLLIGRKTV